jgi:toxin ParE1/3/4
VSQIVRRPAANRDLIAIFRHYARQAGLRVANRFFAQTEAIFNRLAGAPGIGTPYETDEPLYAGLRYFPIPRFRDNFVFYAPTPDGIEVYRVLHGARNIRGILADEFGISDETVDDNVED